MLVCSRRARLVCFVHRTLRNPLLWGALLSVQLTSCINKGDTNIGEPKRMSSKSDDDKSDEDAGRGTSDTSAAATSSDPDDDAPASDDAETLSSDETNSVAETELESAAETELPETSEVDATDPSEDPGSDDPDGDSGGEGPDGDGADGSVTEPTDDSAEEDAPCAEQDIPVSLSAGRDSTCGVTPNGTVKCWGSNAMGQLGTGGGQSSTPVAVRGLCARQVAMGWYHACAIDLEGGVKCWGYNYNGQLGNGKDDDSALPVTVDISGVKQLAAGASHTCALLDDGTVKCWGSNDYGELGNNEASTEPGEGPVAVQGLDGLTVVQITTGSGFSCALLDDGSARCWGNGSYGQLGTGSVVDSARLPQPVVDIDSATQIVAGQNHTCVHLEGGTVMCWGGDSYLSARGGNLEQPQAVAGFFFASVAAGGTFTCALHVDAADGIACWGYDDVGQLGTGDARSDPQDTPRELGSATEGANSLALGYEHACALFPGNVIKCWGRGDSGQLGTGSNTGAEEPVQVQLFL